MIGSSVVVEIVKAVKRWRIEWICLAETTLLCRRRPRALTDCAPAQPLSTSNPSRPAKTQANTCLQYGSNNVRFKGMHLLLTVYRERRTFSVTLPFRLTSEIAPTIPAGRASFPQRAVNLARQQ